MAWVLEYEPLIRLPNEGIDPIRTYWAQQSLLQDRSKRRILNKMRQGGFTTICAVAEAPFDMIYTPQSQIVVLSKSEKEAKNFIDKFYLAYDSVKDKEPNWVGYKIRNSMNVELKNGSRMEVLTSSKGSGRSFTATKLYFDEMAHTQYANEIYKASYPTITRSGGDITLFSTPNGRGDKFHEICVDAKDKGYSYHQYEWWFVPEYNPVYKEFMEAYYAFDRDKQAKLIREARKGKWYRETYASLGELDFAQEYECNFDASSLQVFNSRQLNQMFVPNYMEEQLDEYGEVWRDTKNKSDEYYTFIDYGRKRDATVVVTFGYIDDVWRMVEYKRITPMIFEYEYVINSIRDTHKRYVPEMWHDSTGAGDALSMSIDDISHPMVITNTGNSKLKTNVIENVKRCVDNKSMVMPRIRQLQKEFTEYRYDDKKLVQDCVMAVACCLYKAYDPSEAYVGVDTKFNFVGGDW